jgi:hypothetical protein
MRLRSLALALLITLVGLPTFAAPKQDTPTPGKVPTIIKIIRRLLPIIQPLDDPGISPPHP